MQKFEELIHDIVERTTIPVQNALKDAGLSASDLQRFFLSAVQHVSLVFRNMLRSLPDMSQTRHLILMSA